MSSIQDEDLYYMDSLDKSFNSLSPTQYDNVVEIYGQSTTSCGYCCEDNDSRPKGRRVYDLKALKLTADIYQQLIDRGWRRSGEYCYFPRNRDTCCPNYSISCSATKFELTRSQIKCIDKVNSYLINDSNQSKVKLASQINNNIQQAPDKSHWKRDVKDIKNNFDNLKQSTKARDRRFVTAVEKILRLHKVDLGEAIKIIRAKPRNVRYKPVLSIEDHLYPRRANLDAALLESLKPKHKLQIRLVHVNSNESKEKRQKEHEVLVKYQGAIHKEPPEEWTMPRFANFLINSPIKTEPMRDRNYRSGSEPALNGSNLSVDVFANQEEEFALVRPPPLPTHFGTYHCLYLIDDELIAVGVVDFLPKCLTTVYFFYNPKYSNLNLGIYSALVEISIVREMYKHHRGPADQNQLKHYYMGFYVHQSKKMHYKTSFKPSYLLCPLTRHYVPVEICLPILKERKYARFDSVNEVEATGIPLEVICQIPVSVPVLENSTKLLEYFHWLRSNINHSDVEQLVDSFLVQYAAAIGPSLLSQILVRLHPIHRALVERHRDRIMDTGYHPAKRTS